MKYGTSFLDEQDTRQNTKLKKSVVQSVLSCLSHLFMYILTSKLIKNWEKKLSSKKIKSLNFAESNVHRKTMRTAALRHRIYFLSLIVFGKNVRI